MLSKEASRTEALRKVSAAFQQTPAGSKGPDHFHAQNWTVQAPDGRVYECRNLLHWLREHESMLDGTVEQAYDGIVKTKYSMQGKRKIPLKQWKGWKLLKWEE